MNRYIRTFFILSASLVPVISNAADTIKPLGEVETVKKGFKFTEGPSWDTKGQLYFSDIPNSAIHEVSNDGSVNTFTSDSKHTNGTLVDAQGRLLACQMDGQVVAYDTASKKVTDGVSRKT